MKLSKISRVGRESFSFNEKKNTKPRAVILYIKKHRNRPIYLLKYDE